MNNTPKEILSIFQQTFLNDDERCKVIKNLNEYIIFEREKCDDEWTEARRCADSSDLIDCLMEYYMRYLKYKRNTSLNGSNNSSKLKKLIYSLTVGDE